MRQNLDFTIWLFLSLFSLSYVVTMQIYGQNSRFHFTVSDKKMAALRFTQLRFRRVYDSVYDSDLFWSFFAKMGRDGKFIITMFLVNKTFT